MVRAASDADGAGLIALIGPIFDEYPGCVLDVEGEMPELLRIASYHAEAGGRFWVAERDGVIVGSIGFVQTSSPGGIELKKLYVAASERVHGLGARLLSLVEDAARERGAKLIELWSDTRFSTAHRFYEKRGYVKTGRTRELFDKSETVEFHFEKAL